jgi:hypothetical protein
MKKRVAYLWSKFGPPKLMEIFDGREDLAKKPEIRKDTDKHQAIPTHNNMRRRLIELTDRKPIHANRRNTSRF